MAKHTSLTSSRPSFSVISVVEATVIPALALPDAIDELHTALSDFEHPSLSKAEVKKTSHDGTFEIELKLKVSKIAEATSLTSEIMESLLQRMPHAQNGSISAGSNQLMPA